MTGARSAEPPATPTQRRLPSRPEADKSSHSYLGRTSPRPTGSPTSRNDPLVTSPNYKMPTRQGRRAGTRLVGCASFPTNEPTFLTISECSGE